MANGTWSSFYIRGLIFVLTVTGIRGKIIDAIPNVLKSSIAVELVFCCVYRFEKRWISCGKRVYFRRAWKCHG